MQIKKWTDGTIICEGEKTLKELAQENKTDLSWADLSGTNLSWANLSWADLSWADLSRANLSRADLSGANLSVANLSRADLSRANLSRADLSWANLSRADLSGANLSRAENIEFFNLPSLGTLSRINLYRLSDELQLELMRRDAQAHPHPKLFDEWAKTRKCPYQDEERFWLFEPNPKLWEAGKPKMNDFDLIVAICKSQGWKIRNYLK